ncbi:hypothetical protein HYR69_07370 [Candidatus Sumerlaeota bacterium]|nr:hypothetical protein [Candidatus Sumerlaeota bacterium]
MNRTFFYGLLWMLAALGIERGILPQFGESWDYIHPAEMRLVALAVIIAGCIRTDMQGVFYALLAAIPSGAVLGPGYLGCTIVSFTFSAYVASWLVRWFYLEQFSIRLPVLFVLILIESWVWSEVRHLFWPAVPVELQWPTHLVTAFIGAILYIPIAHWFRYRSGPLIPIGRRKPA